MVSKMNELIKIEQREGIETVNARELHEFIESKQDFSTWIKARIEKYEFIEGTDYVRLHKKMEANNATQIDYFLTMEMAKELSMVENNAKGKEARRYFIDVEKKAKALATKPLSQMDMLRQMFNAYEDQEKRLAQIEAKLETSQNDFYTIAGYCSLRGLKIDVTKANMLGRKASKLSREYSYEIGKANDPRFGTVGTYHLDILSQVIE
jgi:anti-repressor protein